MVEDVMSDARQILETRRQALESDLERITAALGSLGEVSPPNGHERTTAKRGGGKPMSRAQRLATSKRMKAYWAARRKAEKG